jgi:hypothetical protein
MSAQARHFYRFVYLKSEHWRNLRLEKLAERDACCAICKFRDLANDVHHIDYRELYNVQLCDLRVLCRGCHSKLHKLLEAGFGATGTKATDVWGKCKRAIRLEQRQKWRRCQEIVGVSKVQRHARVYKRFKKSRRWLIRNELITIPAQLTWHKKLYRWYINHPTYVWPMDWLNVCREYGLESYYPCGEH